MTIFREYANYYDLLYKDKDYRKESEYIVSLLKKYSKIPLNNILDIGCGTGKHDFEISKLLPQIEITGVDISDDMIKIANKNNNNKNIKFIKSDARNLNLSEKYDAIISLFHVVSYQTRNDDILNMFKNIIKNLKKNGLFIFDFWYGPAVLTIKPENRLKTFENDQIKIYRIANPILQYNQNIVNVNYSILIQNKLTKAIDEINETHNMRYMFIPEIKLFLESTGFKIVDFFEYLTNKTPGLDSWNVCVVGKK